MGLEPGTTWPECPDALPLCYASNWECEFVSQSRGASKKNTHSSLLSFGIYKTRISMFTAKHVFQPSPNLMIIHLDETIEMPCYKVKGIQTCTKWRRVFSCWNIFWGLFLGVNVNTINFHDTIFLILIIDSHHLMYLCYFFYDIIYNIFSLSNFKYNVLYKHIFVLL